MQGRAKAVAKQAAQPVLVTLILGLSTLYFDYRIQSIKNTAKGAKVQAVAAETKTDKGYETLAPLVRDLQEQVKILTAQVELLRQFALSQRSRAYYGSGTRGPVVIDPESVQESIEKIKGTPPPVAAAAEPPPASIPP